MVPSRYTRVTARYRLRLPCRARWPFGQSYDSLLAKSAHVVGRRRWPGVSLYAMRLRSAAVRPPLVRLVVIGDERGSPVQRRQDRLNGVWNQQRDNRILRVW
jgi:hypothetical protein